MKKIIIITLILSYFLFKPIGSFALELGLHMDITWYDTPSIRKNSISAAKSIGTMVSRNCLLWHQIEPMRGTFDWGKFDSVVNELLSAGIEPLFVIIGTPSWANGVPVSTKNYFLYVPTDKTQFELWVKNYETFVKAAVNRYAGKVKKWELWNEQGEGDYWLPPMKTPDQYILWFETIQSAIKNIDPSAEVALGGLTAIQNSGKQLLKDMYDQKIFPDIISIHPYSTIAPNSFQTDPQGNFTDISTIRDIMVEYGQADKKLWVTEWGWSTSKISKETQAEWLKISLDMLKNKYSFVSLATFFTDIDKAQNLDYGLFDKYCNPKPAAFVFKDFVNSYNLQAPTKFNIVTK